MRRITPVILAGGSGTRLWPVSRKSFPKQFAQLVSNESLFQTSARRMAVSAFAAPIVMTSANFRFIISDQLAEIGIQPDEVIIEPSPRNTAPAILAAALKVASRGPEELVLVAPSDHVIPDDSAFLSAVQRGIRLAEEGSIVTFGVKPDRAETGYGYLELAFPADAPQPLKRFVEKPGLAEAKQMLEQGNYLWNSGIFLFKAKTLIDAFRLHADHYIHPVSRALSDATVDLSFTRLATSAWDGLPDQSVDYAVLEKVNNIAVVPLNTRWSDLGGWDAVWRESLVDTAVPDGVVADSFSTAIDCKNVLLTSDSADLHVVGIGLQDLVVVATGDAVLVADKSRTEEVKHAVSCLKERGHQQAVAFRKDRRPWGWYETLALEDRFQVKRIVVKPGASLSLQSHFHRSEHWIVVSGTAKVTVDDVVTLVTENQSIYVPLGSRHRMENPGKFPMVLIEVQTGAYLGEDDIVRYEDIYSREPVG